MRFVSPLLKRVLYPGMAGLGMFRRAPIRGEFCVITYHGVLPAGYHSDDRVLDGNLISAERLRAQLGLLKSRYHVLTPEEFRDYVQGKAPFPPRSVLVTCDDGLENALRDMVPVLQSAGVACLFFVTGESASERSSMLWYEELYRFLMAAPPGEICVPEVNFQASLNTLEHRRSIWWAWVRELSRYPRDLRQNALHLICKQVGVARFEHSRETPKGRRFLLLTPAGIRELVRQGMSVGAHTISHPFLANTSDEQAWHEIQHSREVLTGLLGKDVWALAYPFGGPSSASTREFEMSARAGYECAFLNYGGGFDSEFSRFAIPRVHVTSDMNLGEFEAHVSGFHNRLQQRLGREVAIPCA